MAVRCQHSTGDRLTGAGSLAAGNVTACFWIRLMFDTGPNFFLWGMGGNLNTVADAYALWLNPSKQIDLYRPGGVVACTSAALTFFTWYFVAVVGHTAVSQTWSLWVNGVQVTGSSASGYVSGAIELGGTGDAPSSSYSNARWSNYKHWTTQLTAAQLAAESLAFLPQTWNGLWTWAPLVTVDNLSDLSGQGHGFSATGVPTTERGPALAWSPPYALAGRRRGLPLPVTRGRMPLVRSQAIPRSHLW